MPDGIFHLIQMCVVAIEQGQIQPCERRAVANFDCAPIFFLGGDQVLLFLGESSFDPARFDWVEAGECVGLSLSLVASAAYNPGGFQVELSQIGAGFSAVWTQSHGGLEFIANLLR